MCADVVTRREAVAAVLALAAAPRAFAETPPPPGSARYRLELLVFRQPGAAPRAFPAPPLTPGATIAGRVLPIAREEWQLGPAGLALQRRGFALLSHTAWHTIVPPNGRTTAHLEDLIEGESPVSGGIAVQRGQYLFLGLELDYRAEPPGAVYGLREKRRVKFGERHYFDHPAFGAIVALGSTHTAADVG